MSTKHRREEGSVEEYVFRRWRTGASVSEPEITSINLYIKKKNKKRKLINESLLSHVCYILLLFSLADLFRTYLFCNSLRVGHPCSRAPARREGASFCRSPGVNIFSLPRPLFNYYYYNPSHPLTKESPPTPR